MYACGIAVFYSVGNLVDLWQRGCTQICGRAVSRLSMQGLNCVEPHECRTSSMHTATILYLYDL